MWADQKGRGSRKKGGGGRGKGVQDNWLVQQKALAEGKSAIFQSSLQSTQISAIYTDLCIQDRRWLAFSPCAMSASRVLDGQWSIAVPFLIPTRLTTQMTPLNQGGNMVKIFTLRALSSQFMDISFTHSHICMNTYTITHTHSRTRMHAHTHTHAHVYTHMLKTSKHSYIHQTFTFDLFLQRRIVERNVISFQGKK